MMTTTTTTTTTTTAYPIRYYTHAVPMERQQLQQQQSRVKRKRKSQRYYHSYRSHRTIYISLYLAWTILIATSSRIAVTPSSVNQFIRSNMTPSYKTINSITRMYVYAWNNSVVNILGGKMGTDTDMTTNSTGRLTSSFTQHTHPLWSFRRTYQHNNIQQSTTAEEGEGERQRVLLIVVLFSLFDHTLYN